MVRGPEYWRDWRRDHPEYRARQNILRNARRATAGRDRAAEYAKRPSRAIPPLTPLFPDQRGARLSFWSDELRADLHQERALAILEGRDPDVATRAYERRELEWFVLTVSLHDVA